MDLASAKPSSWLSDQRARGIIYQILLLGCIGTLACGAIYNAVINMRARGIPMGFGFWNDVAGFDINLHLISYSNRSTYGQAFWVGLLNTLLVAVICIPLATLLGFAIGVARLSPNWLLSRFALVYTSIMRNTPLLLLLLFWYNAVLKSLPAPRQSISIGDVVFLNNRGLYLPMPVAREPASWFVGAVLIAIVLAFGFRVWARRRQERTGAQEPTALVAAALILGLPAVVTAAAGAPFAFDIARLSGFNLRGGTPDHPRNGRARVRTCDLHRRVHRGDRSGRRLGGAGWPERGGRRARVASRLVDEAGGHPASDATRSRRHSRRNT